MTNASTVPERDTPAHYVLHSLIRAADRRGIDWRKPSEIAHLGRYAGGQAEVVMGLADLADAGVIVEVTDHGRSGYQVLQRCACAPARETRRTVQAVDNSEDRADFFRSSNCTDHNRLTRRMSGGEACADHPEDCSEGATSFPAVSSVLGTGWESLPTRLEGRRLSKRHGRPCDPDSPMGLALYWDRKIQMEAHPSYREALSPVNIDALRGKFSRWLRDGTATADDIRGSMDRFLVRPYGRRTPPWKQYLHDAQYLMEDHRKAERTQARRDDPEYWLGRPAAPRPEPDLAYWLGTTPA